MWTLHLLKNNKSKYEPQISLTEDVVHHEDKEEERIGIWGFTKTEIDRFPALKKRNFWCIQRHSATAMHYDLRMQIDGGTISWAVPKGLIGISKNGESSRLAVETTIHPISYTTYEGADGRNFSAGRKGGTLLWDIGEYLITKSSSAADSTSDEDRPSRPSKRRRKGTVESDENSEDPDGKYQEDLLRQYLHKKVGYGKSRSIHFVLRGGKKMTNHHFILVLAASHAHTFSASGQIKKTWFLRLPKEVDEYPWDQGGEEGDFWGRSVKTGRTLKEVTAGYVARPERWKKEEERFASWFGDDD
ncbi:DNA ligase D, 3'-phosphoesterase domain-containing protein [Kwoniella pini CBS 10737]|uniref:DNA ligase D, 3'-phosphoesterase domain-containing protein n=1 Tax=Kwoniella pini CBS 10737 TaxID=1296096 RepID=A0A1B9HSY6_9TREE|nr:DNA ligase D, 3'-phosphoesterase domain-containing protein [Kwoniella pini CBS 10737]OCF46375.1 DNA ligase D, 3'-phosphoesterase domain-containing protein [Kwoniella pini CBS 10737]